MIVSLCGDANQALVPNKNEARIAGEFQKVFVLILCFELFGVSEIRTNKRELSASLPAATIRFSIRELFNGVASSFARGQSTPTRRH